MLAAAAARLDITAGLIAAHDAAAEPGGPIAVYAAGHPAPNAASAEAGEHALRLAAASRARSGLLVLLSGGASAMLAAPVPGVSLEDKVETARLLMRAGAAIDELNCVRKHLSRIKGGRLAAAAGQTITLALSDVHAPVPDDPSVIGSGPTVPDPTTFAGALSIVQRFGVPVPASVRQHLEAGAMGAMDETVKPDDPRISSTVYRVIGNRHTAAEGARLAAAASGYDVVVFDDVVAGEAREAGAVFAARALHSLAGRRRACVIGSGETTVTVRGSGRGGRNQEFVLGAAGVLESRGAAGAATALASAGTDGVDGPTDAAGGLADATTRARAQAAGLGVDRALAENDAYACLAAMGDLIRWGPTGTNVGDLHIVLVS